AGGGCVGGGGGDQRGPARLGGAGGVPRDRRLVPRLPAQPARPPVQVDVLDVGEEALVEWPRGPLAELREHRQPVQGGRGSDAKDLLGSLPLARIGQALAAVARPTVPEKDVA